MPVPIHRRPLLPFADAPAGWCRLCGEGVAPPRRRWHRACAERWTRITSRGLLRHAVWRRDGGHCALCGVRDRRLGGAWEVDHIVPLVECRRDDLDKFDLPNLRTLCPACHQAATAAWRARRGAPRRRWRRCTQCGTRRAPLGSDLCPACRTANARRTIDLALNRARRPADLPPASAPPPLEETTSRLRDRDAPPGL